MLAHDPVRTRLRDALEHSAAGKSLRGARARWADAWSHARLPSKTEIRGLEQRGNVCDDWSAVRLLGAGPLTRVHGCRFEGHCILRLDRGGPVLRDSLVRDSFVGAATVESVALLDRVVVEDGAVLRHVSVCSGAPDSRHCLGLAIHPGSETGARRVFLADGLSLDDCTAMAALPPEEQDALAAEWKARLRPCVSDHATVGRDARIEFTRFVEDCFVGDGAHIRGAAALRRCILASADAAAGAAAVFVGDGVIAEDCLLESGARLESAAQARRTLFLEHSGAGQGGHVADSVIGPGTEVAKGEVTASLVGPFVGFHHQALLIGALWPEGRGNVGYGANVGSNHTGRKPDQELKPGEGTFFGLSCAVKFPADFSGSPYSLFATGVTTPPQKISLPFSLIVPGGDVNHPGRNEIVPGWMWGENAYALIRNAYKYAARNRAVRHAVPRIPPPAGSPLAGTFLAADLFAPPVVDRVVRALTALDALDALPGSAAADESAWIDERTLPAAGRNHLRTTGLGKARAAYRHFLAYAFFRAVLWEPEPPIQPSSQTLTIAGHAGLDVEDIPACLAMLEGLADAVEASLRRDSDRGAGVFGDYAAFHGDPREDAVCVRLRAETTALAPLLQARLAVPG